MSQLVSVQVCVSIGFYKRNIIESYFRLHRYHLFVPHISVKEVFKKSWIHYNNLLIFCEHFYIHLNS